MSYFKAEVLADDSGIWATNALVFRTAKDASAYARELASRWTAVRDWRVREATPEEVDRGILKPGV